ncbi:hypothetical protein Pint_16143 [Pistacia integerrima]|uniref:Uncharacterized protein n=1 Tax=Pistacia integerrima TaxID=434235 RepID=A0ACC0ZB72_9ROSI|nr:hypothetical protein Pint_16143 [Pistacia integerrima]
MEVIRSRKRNVVDSKNSGCASRQRGNLLACGEISMATEGNNRDRSKSPPMRKYREVVGNFNRPSIDKGLAGVQKVAMRDLSVGLNQEKSSGLETNSGTLDPGILNTNGSRCLSVTKQGVCDDSSGKKGQSNGGFEWAGSGSNHVCNFEKMVDANAYANVILGSSGLYGQDRSWAKLAIDHHQKEKVKLTYVEPTVEQDSIITGCPPLSVALKKWHPVMELNKVCPKSISLKVKFFDIPMELVSLVGLSYMASTMGKPLALDRITEETCDDKLGYIGFVRILIEVDASPKLSKMIRMRMPSEEFCEENPMVVMVDYQ